MKRLFCIAVLVAAAAVSAPALAQGVLPPPELQNRIPAPLPPPLPPPIINGPLGQGPAPGVYQPPRLDTHSDRTVRCLDQGANAGLSGRKLQSYASRCANAN